MAEAWVQGAARQRRVPMTEGDGRRLPLHLLVEVVLRLRLGQGVPVGYGLDGRVVPGRKYLTLDLIAKCPVTVESIPGEGQEPPFLAPFRVLYVISH